MSSWISDIIITFFEAVCCQMFFSIFSDENKKYKKGKYRIITTGVLGLLYFAVGNILASNFILREIIGIVITSVIMIMIRDIKIKKAGVLSIFFFGLLVAVEYLAFIYMQIVASDPGDASGKEEVIISFIAIVDMLILFLCILFIRRFFRGKQNRMLYDEEWIKYLIFPIFTIIVIGTILASFKYVNDSEQIRSLYAISFGMLIMNFLVFYLMEDIARKGELLREKEIFEVQGKNQLEMYNSLNESLERKRSESHEFKNHILCIQSLVENGDYEKLKSYVSDLNKYDPMLINVIDTNNSIINAVVNTKYREAVGKHIVFTFRLNDLSDIMIEEKDVVVLLSNLLNNAIEACEKCRDNRVIKLKFIHDDDGIILSVRNTYETPVLRAGDDFITTKEDNREIHGIGIKNILKIITKYDGIYSIKTENNDFYFSVMFHEGNRYR